MVGIEPLRPRKTYNNEQQQQQQGNLRPNQLSYWTKHNLLHIFLNALILCAIVKQ